MRRALRPLAVFGIATGVSLAAALQLAVGGARGSDAPPEPSGDGFHSGYDLGKLSLVDPTLFYIEEQYVEPGRIDWERMFVSALEAVEREVPACMFTREPGSDVLSVEIGEYRTVLGVQPVDSMEQLETELSRIADLLTRHLDARDLDDDGVNDPFAEIEYALINGMLETLDPHSVLMPPEDSREMDLENRGAFGGLGITIEHGEVGLVIAEPIPDSPAERSGLLPEDRIVRIDGESTINMSLDDAVERLRGEIGESVTLQIDRDSFQGVPRDFEIVREEIPLKPVAGRLLDGGIAYVSIQSFHQEVQAELRSLLTQLARNEAGGELRGLVLDLRDNPGGYLNQAVAVADQFLTRGTIVSTVDGAGRRLDLEEASPHNAEPDYPIAVLVNASSASASEIVAGALRNNDRAIIVGERTFGKGSVQNLHPFYDQSKLKLTVSKYLTPGDKSIQSVGIPADIALIPSQVEHREPSMGGDVASVFSREQVRREADLGKHLDRIDFHVEEPAYEVRYWRPAASSRRDGVGEEDDYDVMFARDVLLAAPSSRRAAVLVAASAVVQKHRRVQNQRIVDHFREIGIDWTDGPAAERGGELPLGVEVSVGPDGHLVAGEDGTVTVTVTNRSDRPLHRVVLVADHDGLLDGREFVFGHLRPGESGSWSHDVSLVSGTPAERAPLAFDVRDAGVDVLGRVDSTIEVVPKALPALAWSWHASDADGGDGDGLPEVGETIRVQLTVTNQGAGPTVSPFARIRNRSRKALDIVEGNVEPGFMRTADGEPCAVEVPGVEAGNVVGDPSSDPARIARGDPPTWAAGCVRVLEPGEEWTGAFTVALREPPETGLWTLELGLGDHDAYDHGTVVEAAFWDYFDQSDRITLPVGRPMLPSGERSPPSVRVTRAPGPVSELGRATISGVVNDDVGVSHVLVFAGDDKVFYQGAGASSMLKAVPFTADVSLSAGRNVITVLAEDVDGHTHSASIVTWYGRDAALAHADAP